LIGNLSDTARFGGTYAGVCIEYGSEKMRKSSTQGTLERNEK